MTGKFASIITLGAALAFAIIVTQTPLAKQTTASAAGLLHQAGQAMLQTAGSPVALRVSFNR